jgi:transcriptional regulator with XRE-family HTH domain
MSKAEGKRGRKVMQQETIGEETFGEKVARLRKEKQMTQAKLAAIMHVTDKAVSKWECDVAYPDITSLPLLATSLGITVDELLLKTTKARKSFQPRSFLGILLSAIIVLLSVFQITTARFNHMEWIYDCIQLLVLGGVIWSFQKRTWLESSMDFIYKVFVISVGISLVIWALLEEQGGSFLILAGSSIALFGARLLCLPVSKTNAQKPEQIAD